VVRDPASPARSIHRAARRAAAYAGDARLPGAWRFVYGTARVTEGPDKRALALLALLSAVTLGLEVFLSRLVSYSVQVVLLYAVLGIAMLGFGAAGSLVAVRQRWLEPTRCPQALAWAATAFAIAVVVAHATFLRITPFMQRVDTVSLLASALLALPYLAAGSAVTLALSSAGPRIGAAYGANLVGSGLGCFLPLLLLGPLDGERFLALTATLAAACALGYAWLARPAPRSWLAGAQWLTWALCAASWLAPERVFPIRPEPLPLGQLAGIYEHAQEHGIGVKKRYDRWNPTGRVEIVALSNVPGGPEPYPAMYYAQDSTAGSSLLQWDGRDVSQTRPTANDPSTFVARLCSETLYGQGYFEERKRALVIGLGGGPDLQCALYHRVPAIDVVEINRDSVAALSGPLADWVGHITSRPGVRIHVRDGRSFVHAQRAASGPRYDLIQLTGADTKHNLASGAHALSENHLYTLESFHDYLSSLSRKGVLSIIRFGEHEALRLANTAAAALRELGVQRPASHFMVMRTGVAYGLIVSRAPLRKIQVDALRARLSPPHFRGAGIYYYTAGGVTFEHPATVEHEPFAPPAGHIGAYFTALARGAERAFADLYPFDLAPTTDDRPFFFDVMRYDRPDTWRADHVVAIRNILVSIVVLSVLLIVLPLRLGVVGGDRGGAQPGAEPSSAVHARRVAATFFLVIGLGFVLLQVWLLHTFAMYLGHQVYSLSIVLSTLLIATGLGAQLGERLGLAPPKRALAGALGVAAFAVLMLVALRPALEATWHLPLPARAAVAFVFILPLGWFLGQPFVSGLSWLRARAPRAVPWCIGINAFASVIASVSAIPLSMAFGYRTIALCAIALYAAAAGLARLMARPT
jgi:hypothetical protein